MRRHALSPVCIALLFSSAFVDIASGQSADRIKVGLRDDARPFIWKDPVSNKYLGFFWSICSEATLRAGYQFEMHEVNASQRASFLRTGEGGYDLLCDPTTITLSRMQNFADTGHAPHLQYSPIIFVANASFVQLKRGGKTPRALGSLPEDAPARPSCSEVEAWLGRYPGEGEPGEWNSPLAKDSANSGAAESFLEWLSDLFTLREVSKPPNGRTMTFEFWGYVEGSSSTETVRANAIPTTGDRLICARPMTSHRQAAKEFCADHLARYYGDVDMVKAAVANAQRLDGSQCAADETPTAVGSYEPYAFVVSTQYHANFPERFSLSLYGMFEDGTIERFFAGHFPNAEKSVYLGTLFKINSIPQGLKSGSEDDHH